MRRNGLKIMANLMTLVSSLAYVIIIAIFNGALGFLFSMSITILGSIGIAKLLGATFAISWSILFALIIVFGCLRGVLRYLEQYANHYIAFKLLAVLRDKIFTALRKLAPAKLENKQKGSIISMITADIETLEVFYAHTISPIGIAITVSICVILFLGFVVNWYVALYLLFAHIIIGLILPIINSKYLKNPGVTYRENFSLFNGFFMDSIKGAKDIIMHSRQKKKEEEVVAHTKQLLIDKKKISNRTDLTIAVSLLAITILNLGMLALTIVLSRNGIMERPLIVVSMVTIMSAYGPVIALNALPGSLNQTFASGERVMRLLEEKPAVNDILDGSVVDFKELEIKDLSFSYDKVTPVLENISLKVKEGQILGIMGKSGCGKSTILKLILRFWEKDRGEILINNIDVDCIKTDSLKKNVAMVSQTTYLFNDTILNNVRISKNNATEEEVIEACKKASIHNFIIQLKDGYNTKIGDKGFELSAGESQRVGLARAFLSSAKLILLDEPTSNVDSINEGIILNAIKNNVADNAFIIVSHRESTLSIADSVYKMDKK